MLRSWEIDMTQARRRILFWVLVVALIAIGAIIQARAHGEAESPPHAASLKTDPDAEFITEEKALLQEFRCALSVIYLQLPLAEEECGRAIALSPQDPIGYKYRGFLYLLEHRFADAEADLLEAVTLYPQDADSQAGYAQALTGQGRFGEAVTRFGVALMLAPADVRFLAARCWARGAEGKDFPAALQDCNRAIRLEPGNAVSYDSRGLVYLRLGKAAQARSDYATALKLQPERATALFGRGIAELRLKQIDKATADIRQARTIDPEIDDIYILAGVLQEGCRRGDAPCDLPAVLRPQPKDNRSYLSVSRRYSAP